VKRLKIEAKLNFLVGDDGFIQMIHDGDPGRQRFYRVKIVPLVP
jgi:hypothetical protein